LARRASRSVLTTCEGARGPTASNVICREITSGPWMTCAAACLVPDERSAR
jgi:hypothetical protein